MKEPELIEFLRTKESPLVIEWINSNGDKRTKSFDFRELYGRPFMYREEIEFLLGKINCKPCKTQIQ